MAMELQFSSLFPLISDANKRCHGARATSNIMLSNNPVSSEVITMLNKEWKGQHRVSPIGATAL